MLSVDFTILKISSFFITAPVGLFGLHIIVSLGLFSLIDFIMSSTFIIKSLDYPAPIYLLLAIWA